MTWINSVELENRGRCGVRKWWDLWCFQTVQGDSGLRPPQDEAEDWTLPESVGLVISRKRCKKIKQQHIIVFIVTGLQPLRICRIALRTGRLYQPLNTFNPLNRSTARPRTNARAWDTGMITIVKSPRLTSTWLWQKAPQTNTTWFYSKFIPFLYILLDSFRICSLKFDIVSGTSHM